MAKCADLIKYPLEYTSWYSMNWRTSPNNTDPEKLKYYSGVEVHYTWRLSFKIFLKDMGRAPGPGYTIDRIDNSLGYCKQNCRWATAKEQANNRTNNVKYHLHESKGYWIVRQYKDGERKILGTYKSRRMVELLYGI